MLETLRTAFNGNHQVRIDYRPTGLNSVILRVAVSS
jgi:hypothetical protein